VYGEFALFSFLFIGLAKMGRYERGKLVVQAQVPRCQNRTDDRVHLCCIGALAAELATGPERVEISLPPSRPSSWAVTVSSTCLAPPRGFADHELPYPHKDSVLVEGRAPLPLDTADAVENMAYVDAAYRAAGLTPR
jgi:hypothetical protein